MSQHPRIKRWLGWPVAWGIHVGLWLAFVSQAPRVEVYVALGAAAVATIAAGILQAVDLVRFGPHGRHLLEARRLPVRIIIDTGRVLGALWQGVFTRAGPRSQMLALPFDVGGDDPACAARRALAVIYMSMTPNTIALGIVPGQQVLLFHELEPSSVSREIINLGGRP